MCVYFKRHRLARTLEPEKRHVVGGIWVKSRVAPGTDLDGYPANNFAGYQI